MTSKVMNNSLIFSEDQKAIKLFSPSCDRTALQNSPRSQIMNESQTFSTSPSHFLASRRTGSLFIIIRSCVHKHNFRAHGP